MAAKKLYNRFTANKTTMLIVIAIVVILAVFVYLKYFKKGKVEIDPEIDDNGDSDVIPSGGSTSAIFPLQKGSGFASEGKQNAMPYVKELQKWLNKQRFLQSLPLNVDGKFGDKTEANLEYVTGNKRMSKEQYEQLIGF